MRRKLSVSLFIILGLSIFMTSCNQKKFEGSRTANQEFYNLDIEQMNGTDTHKMKLNTGDILEIHFETTYGKINMKIKAPDDALIYTGSGEEVTDFTINISKSGVYSFFVKAQNAKGTIHIKRVNNDIIS